MIRCTYVVTIVAAEREDEPVTFERAEKAGQGMEHLLNALVMKDAYEGETLAVRLVSIEPTEVPDEQ